ncbi:6-phosphogluconate dehydrogenase C-terminal domain-like protein [Sodiomyces alkalinus F11]|uniref:6-phosphogluconate dehydrogenase C-terminal domain-like protein n=1 Tax=Sodiomyces alkalinus (strain CBS 110278 / VKM F-3762 / F11) TaxID=1314773 RepID=A0A3N2PVE6_SODAK|nr:6-phosphogluconate dehydrogenase C-terminal domain-like protein [Sodiomyces alkalinus F11]ROT38462.1 6-phosphogluconate dehydrogenase C-terminal domain-like protein [Sodiomyces alkalinus F11]
MAVSTPTLTLTLTAVPIANRIGQSLSIRLSSQRLFSSKAERMEQPPWLRNLLADVHPPPKLYAWTTSNLPQDTDSEKSNSSPRKPLQPAHVESCSDPERRRRIYILGIGNLGILFATSLAKLPDRPPITLVVHREELLRSWAAHPGLEIIRGSTTEKLADFNVEWWTDQKPTTGTATEVAQGSVIPTLLVTTKASVALPQVDRIRRYLGATSTVAFAQNGICKLWPPYGAVYTSSRFPPGAHPNFFACVTTHGVTSDGRFRSEHASVADVKAGPVLLNPSAEEDEDAAGIPAYLPTLLARAPGLHGKSVPTDDLWILQLEKLAVNCVVNPLTAVLRCKNGALFERPDGAVMQLIDKLLLEASAVFRQLIQSPSTDAILGKERREEGSSSSSSRSNSDEVVIDRDILLDRFSYPQLKRMVLEVGHKVRQNTSSMLQDVRAGKPTEIRDVNGWLLDTAAMLGRQADVRHHRTLVALVESRTIVDEESILDHFPSLRPSSADGPQAGSR